MYLIDHGRMAEGVRRYEEYVERAVSEVTLANTVRWLVRHYHDTGEAERTTALADRAAEAYSYWGLITRADLYDWRGELDRAEEYYLKAFERYDTPTASPNEVTAFYLRRKRSGAHVDRLVKRAFPEGLQSVTLQSLNGPPADGVIFTTVGRTGERSGMRKDDIVVAVDGIRVRTFDQYRIARLASADPDIRFIVWRDGRYQEVTARLRVNWPWSHLTTWVREQEGRTGDPEARSSK